MKKIFIFFICAFLMFSSIWFYKDIDVVYAEGSEYARILRSGVRFYREPINSEDNSNVYFNLQKSYFVELLESSNEYFYKAKYINLVGYVRKNEVQCVVGTPQKKYADEIGFRIFSLNGLNLRKEPTQTKGLFSVVASIPYLETNLQFYGEIQGEEAISYKGATWYYCKYVKNTEELYGYVYAVFCDMLTEIEENLEVLEYKSEPSFAVVPAIKDNAETSENFSFSNFSTLKQALIIVAVCIPCFIIIYLLFKPTKITVNSLDSNDKKTSNKKRVKRKRGQDYYEYD